MRFAYCTLLADCQTGRRLDKVKERLPLLRFERRELNSADARGSALKRDRVALETR
jgi:hypothetical protein